MSQPTTNSTATLPLLALLLAGCTGPGLQGPDPLVGGSPIQNRISPPTSLAAGLSPTNTSGIGNNTATPTSGGQLPALPSPSSATSPAALAAGVMQTQDNSRDLRIPSTASGSSTTQGTPTSLTQEQPLWRDTSGTIPPSGNTQPSGATPPSAVQLTAPQPTGGGAMATTPMTAPSAPNSMSTTAPAALNVLPVSGKLQISTYEQAQEELARHHVTFQQFEVDNSVNQWRFHCWISDPDPAKPNVEHRYDAQGRSLIEAIQKVLDQMTLEHL